VSNQTAASGERHQETAMKKLVTWAALAVVLAATALPAPAAGEPAGTDKPGAKAAETGGGVAKAISTVAACLGAGLAALGGAYGVGKIGSMTVESMARQPEASREMFAPMIVSAGMIEVGMLFAILVCLLKG